MHHHEVFPRRYWPVLQRLPDPPPEICPRLAKMGPPPRHVWRRCYRYLESLRTRWRV